MNTKDDAKIINEEIIKHDFLTIQKTQLQHRLYSNAWSPILKREVVLSPAVVAILLYDPEPQKVLLIEQFRPAALHESTAWITEIVAGHLEKGENVSEAAHREVLEETGCTLKKIVPIVSYFSAIGFSSEKIHLVCGLFSSTEPYGQFSGNKEEAEDIRTILLDKQEAFHRLEEGCINNASTIIALQWLKLHGNQPIFL